MNLFETVKAEVSARRAADLYGIETDRTGKALCIFHNEKRPSMKIYDEPNRGFYCFSCGKGGTVIDLIAQYYGISVYEAARKIAGDFGIREGYITHLGPVRKDPEQEYRQQLKHYTQIMTEYLLRLERWLTYAPRTPEEEPNILFITALEQYDRVKEIAETLLQGTKEERAEIIIYHKSELQKYEQRVTGRI